MVNKNELLCVVDEYDTPLTPLPRHEVFKNGHWRRTAHVWIMNGKRKLLCQQRSLKKDMSPGKWEPAVVGHIGPDDNYFTGALREVREETGLDVKVEDLTLIKIYKDHSSKEFRGIFYCKLDIEKHHVKSEVDEVEQVKFFSMSSVKKFFSTKPDLWIEFGYEKEVFALL